MRRDPATALYVAIIAVGILLIVVGIPLLLNPPAQPAGYYFPVAWALIALGVGACLVGIGGLFHVWGEHRLSITVPVIVQQTIVQQPAPSVPADMPGLLRDGVWWVWIGSMAIPACPEHRRIALRCMHWERGEQAILDLRADDEIDGRAYVLRCSGDPAPHLLDLRWPHQFSVMQRDAEDALMANGLWR